MNQENKKPDLTKTKCDTISIVSKITFASFAASVINMHQKSGYQMDN